MCSSISSRSEDAWQVHLACWRERLSTQEFEEAWHDGSEWSVDHAIQIALSKQTEAAVA